MGMVVVTVDVGDGDGYGGGGGGSDVGGDGCGDVGGNGGGHGGGGCLLSRTLCSLLTFFQDLTLAGCLPRRPSILSGPWSLTLWISSAWLWTTSSKNLCLRQSLNDTQ